MKSTPMQLHVKGDMKKKASTTLEEARTEEACRRQREIWLEENREEIEEYNKLVMKYGVFSHRARYF